MKLTVPGYHRDNLRRVFGPGHDGGLHEVVEETEVQDSVVLTLKRIEKDDPRELVFDEFGPAWINAEEKK